MSTNRIASDLELLTDKKDVSVADVAEIFAQAGWTRNRTPDQIERMLAHTDLVVMAKAHGKPVGFARVITDRTFRAFVEDVIVAEDVRQSGVGKQMMATLEQLVLDLGIARMELTTTQDGFWEKQGYVRKDSSIYMVKYLS